MIDQKLVQQAEVHRALRDELRTCVSPLASLVAARPDLIEEVERTLALSGAPAPARLAVDSTLAASLPPGMCERLLAFPTGRDPIAGVIDVVAVDAEDTHVAGELSAHLGRPVRLHRAGLRALLEAAGVAVPPKPTSDPPIVRVSSTPHPSERPIPLVRRSTGERPRERSSTSLGLGGGPLSSRPPEELPEFRAVEERLTLVQGPEDVVQAVAFGAGVGSLVFSVKAEGFFVRAVGGSRDRPKVLIPREGTSILSVVIEHGEFEGPVFDSGAHALLVPWLRAGQPVFSVLIDVRRRPALVVVLPALGRMEAAKRRGRQLVDVASCALEELIVRRKRSGND